MSVVEPPSSQPSDSLDGLLRKFFRSQLPHPWPAPRGLSSISSCQRRPTVGQSLMRSRWALAASVALLLFGSFLLPNRFPQDVQSENGLSGPHISDRNILPERSKRHQGKPNEAKNKSGLAVEEGDQLPDLDDSDLPFLK